MSTIKKVAIFGASGNFGTPITSALVDAGFDVTVVTRIESQSTFPPGLPVIKTEYTAEKLTAALAGQDAVISVVGPGGLAPQVNMIDAAEAVGVKRFIINDFGLGPDHRGYPEFSAIGATRRVAWDHAKQRSEVNPNFTYTGITIGNPIDWALPKFPLMGFNVSQNSAMIYDAGTEEFTGTTLEGIGQAVVGVFQHPEETANRFVKARSIQVCQNALLEAFQSATGKSWEVKHSTAKEMLESGRRKNQAGEPGWILDLLVAQLYAPGEGRCIVASREDSDAGLLGIREETAAEIVAKALGK